MRFLAALLIYLASAAAVIAQGCGGNNPNCVVPTRPAGDSTKAAANTEFVTSVSLSGNLRAANNLSDVANAATARSNLGINAPTYQSFLSGSGTYTPTAGTVRIKVRMAGGGGGRGGADE